MTKVLPILSFLLLMVTGLIAQDYDYETDESTVVFTYFGSSSDGSNAPVIDNPNPTGINTSSKVVEYVKASGSETWAGAFSNPMLPVPYDMTAGGQVCVDVHFDHIGNLAFKLEKSTNGVSNWVTTVENTLVGEWETLCFDLDANGLEDSMTPATGGIFDGVALFFDFGMTDPDNDVTTYFDNMRYVAPAASCVTIFDFEAAETTTAYTYFGSTLDGQAAANIANPNPTGVNTSATVVEYVKPVGAETWAGSYADPLPTTPIDATNGGEICIDVHMDHIGNVALKLEQSTTGGPDWVVSAANTVMNEWEQICIDLGANSIEDPMMPAAGNVYAQLVVFVDFGMAAADVDVTTYFDNLVYKPASATEMYDVTFEVDLNNYSGTFTQPYVSGTFNGWSADANPLSDADMDGVWSTTLSLLGGAYEYKFQLDGWNDSDQLLQSDECAITFIDGDGNVFTNRNLLVTEEMSTGAVCFNSCYLCGDEASITWNVNMSNEDAVSDDGVFVAGGPFFGHGDLPAMTDDDGDGVHSITIRRQKGFESDYTFINGLCLPDWSCKEMIAGQDCAVMPFNDRHLDPVNEDVVINTCFGECSTTTECSGGPVKYNATFQVDMTLTAVDPMGMFLAGELINGWAGDTPMTDVDGDGIYEVTVELAPAIVEYKYVNGTYYEQFTEGDCTMTDPSGQFINRFFIMEEKDTILAPYLFETCDLFVSIKNIEFNENLFTLIPNLTSDFTTITCDVKEDKLVQIHDLNGQLISQYNMAQNQTSLEVDMTTANAGLYIVSVTTANYLSTKRIVVR